MQRNIKIISLILVGILALALLALFFRWRSLPIYTLNQNSLKIADQLFVSGPSEFELEPIKLGRTIGRTDEGFRVYNITDQNPNNYVYVRGLMFDALYRNITAPLIDRKRMSISGIQLISTQGMKSIIKKTSDELSRLWGKISLW